MLPLSESIFCLICQKVLLGAPYFILFIIVSDVNYITQYFLSSDWLVLASGKPYLAKYINYTKYHILTKRHFKDEDRPQKTFIFSLFYPKLRVATGQIFLTTSIRSCLARLPACNKKCHRQSLFLRLAGRLYLSPKITSAPSNISSL